MQVELDQRTAEKVAFAAKIASISPAEVIARLVEGHAPVGPSSGEAEPDSTAIPVFARYLAEFVEGVFDLKSGRLDITTGDLAGQSFASPSAAAKAVIERVNPDREYVHTNGWRFWRQSSNRKPIDFLRR